MRSSCEEGPGRSALQSAAEVEVKRRNRCIVSAEKAIGGHGPRVGAPCTEDINQEEGIGLWGFSVCG